MKCEKCKQEHDSFYGSGRFCSAKCARSFSTSKDKKETKIIKCITCKKEIKVDKRASDKTCKCNKCKKVKKKIKKKKIQNIKYCLYCNKKIGKSSIKCCSRECLKKYKWKLRKEKIINDNGIGHDIRQLKKYFIDITGHKCSICKNTKWMNKLIPLILDHINGRAKDNTLNNLRLVCGNCDMQLPTYKSKNKNSDRQRIGKYL